MKEPMLFTKSRVIDVRPAGDLASEIEFELEIGINHLEVKELFHLVDWRGDAVFYRTPAQSGSYSSQRYHGDQRRLPLRFVPALDNEPKGFGNNQVKVILAAEATSIAMERLEQFRKGTELNVRIEGNFVVLLSPRLEKQLEAAGPPLWCRVLSENFEITRDRWSEVILPALFPPGKLVVETDLSTELPVTERSLKAARRAFYDGRYEDMARELFVFLEDVKTSSRGNNDTEEVAALRRTWEGIKSLLNAYRHKKPDVQPLDRDTARFLLLAGLQVDLWVRL